MRKTFRKVFCLCLAVMTMGSLFSGCSAIPRDTPFTFRVENDVSGEGEWTVRTDERDVVSYVLTRSDDGKTTDVVFTGLRKGAVKATLFRGTDLQTADDAYVLTLRVDLRHNVTQTEPRYGAYTVRLNGDVTGAQWHVECADERIVHTLQDREYPRKSSGEDGMQEFRQLFTFTGRRPGATRVRIYTTFPWADDAENPRESFWLYVDDEYRVSLLDAQTDFTSFRLSEHGSSAVRDVYEARRTENGVRFSHYYATESWSDEARDHVETRSDETVIDGGEALYLYLSALLYKCRVDKWDGFQKSDPRILDGKMFSFEAELADGTQIRASGSNAYPAHYRDFGCTLDAAIHTYAPQEDVQ